MCIICTIFHHLSKATDTLLIMTEHPFGLNNYDSARRPWLMCTNKFIYCTSFLLSIYSCTEGYTNYKSIVLITPFDILWGIRFRWIQSIFCQHMVTNSPMKCHKENNVLFSKNSNLIKLRRRMSKENISFL